MANTTQANTPSHFNDLLDDLTLQQYNQLLAYLWSTQQCPTRNALRSWRRSVGMAV